MDDLLKRVPYFRALKTSGKVTEIINSFDNNDFELKEVHRFMRLNDSDSEIDRINGAVWQLFKNGRVKRRSKGKYTKLGFINHTRTDHNTIKFYKLIASEPDGIGMTHKDTDYTYYLFHHVQNRLLDSGLITITGIKHRITA